MTPAAVKKFLLALPAATMNVQWGMDEVYKIGGKMFAVTMLSSPSISFKCSDDSFEILTKQAGVVPAPYLARAKWVYLDRAGRLKDQELREYLRRAHAIVASGLPKKTQRELFGEKGLA
jgi:predicted DNA-binding protein (MmcQ/YjbR family)